MKHTQLPWKAKICPTGNSVCVVGADGTIVLEIPRFVRERLHQSNTHQELADVRFIITACNSHDVLLEACEGAKKYLEPDLVEPSRTVFWKLVAALKAAKGGTP